jgi:hypothetical protein
MGKGSIFLIGLLTAWLGAACCHVNGLRGRASEPGAVDFTAEVSARIRLVFTRQINSQAYRMFGNISNVTRSMSMFDRALTSFLPVEIAKSLVDEVPKAFQRRMGWQKAVEGGRPALRLDLLVKDFMFLAIDPVSPVTVTWSVRVTLTDLASDEVLWRDCLDFTEPAGFGSMEDLDRDAPAERAEILRIMTNRLANWLAGLVAEEAGNDRSRQSKEKR